MNLIKFLKSLVGSLKKGDIVGNILGLKEELEDHTLPLFQKFKDAGLFGPRFAYKSNWAKSRVAEFNVKTKNRGSLIDVISSLLSVLPKQLDELGKIAGRTGGNEVVISGVTYQMGTLLQLIDNLRFFSSYSRKLLMMLAYYEYPDGSATPPYSKAIVAKIESEFTQYCELTSLLLSSGNALSQIVARIPNVVVDSDGIVGVIQGGNVEPIRMGLAPSRYNLVWRIRSAIAEAQADYYNEAQAEALLLELMLIDLKAKLAGQPDNAALDKQIKYHENRLMELTNHLLEVEQTYA
jgi:hypothetical protein